MIHAKQIAAWAGNSNDMDGKPMDANEQAAAKKDWNRPAMKAWSKPEVRDQSIHSLTESKPNQNPTEASPGTGS